MNRHKYWVLIFILVLKTQCLQNDSLYNFVVWNVGQGSWATYSSPSSCIHFDSGGEIFPLEKILNLCRKKKNFFLITHEDWDHINGLIKVSRKFSDQCLYFPKKRTKKILQKLSLCSSLPPLVEVLSLGTATGNQNASSVIYLFAKKILITGDAPRREEKKWLAKLPSTAKILIVGHHGSNTSTSTLLIQKMKPKMAIVSARKSKYGHPHPLVLSRLHKKRVPVLKTETLGNIYLNIKTKSFERRAYNPFPNRRRPLHKSQPHHKH